MASGTILELPHLSGYSIHISLFKDVRNAPFLRQQLVEANAEFEYAFLDATMIISINHVLAAVFRATNDLIHNRLKSRNVHSEIVFSLSPNNNIAESFRRFGIVDTTTFLLAVKILDAFNPDLPDPSAHLDASVEGTRVDFTGATLSEITDLSKIRKVYKLDSTSGQAAGGSKKGKGGRANGTASIEKRTNGIHEQTGTLKEMEAVIIGIMALKGS